MERSIERQKVKRNRWWQQDRPVDALAGTPAGANFPAPKKGDSCPKCLMDDLDYDTLFRLSCPVCGYVAECGAFT